MYELRGNCCAVLSYQLTHPLTEKQQGNYKLLKQHQHCFMFLRLFTSWRCTNAGFFFICQVRSVSSVVTRRREQRVLVMVVVMVVCYLICWLPYGVTALLATFGPRDLLTPEASITPSLLAKFSTVINPFIYIFMNKQVRRSDTVFYCMFFLTVNPSRSVKCSSKMLFYIEVDTHDGS